MTDQRKSLLDDSYPSAVHLLIQSLIVNRQVRQSCLPDNFLSIYLRQAM